MTPLFLLLVSSSSSSSLSSRHPPTQRMLLPLLLLLLFVISRISVSGCRRNKKYTASRCIVSSNMATRNASVIFSGVVRAGCARTSSMTRSTSFRSKRAQACLIGVRWSLLLLRSWLRNRRVIPTCCGKYRIPRSNTKRNPASDANSAAYRSGRFPKVSTRRIEYGSHSSRNRPRCSKQPEL